MCADTIHALTEGSGAYAGLECDLHPPLNKHEAHVEADRCYFCYDAPCMNACPTEIDIPMFIRQISADNPMGAAKTIFDQNILGGMCARVCPTETLCEQACVREEAEGKPVKIGQLQRYATDIAMQKDTQFYARAAATGKTVAVVGAGPAGLACAHRLAMHGHNVVVFEARQKPGGLNEFGIAAYKATDDFAQKEVAWLLEIGGIEIRYDQALGRDFSIDELTENYDAVFVGVGLSAASMLSIAGSDLAGVEPAIDFIARLRQADDYSKLKVGTDVVVIGGGMTAVDAAVQSKLLGARTVSLVYRRDREKMSASRYEQDLAAAHGVHLVFNASPVAFAGGGSVQAAEFELNTGEKLTLPADQVLVAIGQRLDVDAALDKDGATFARDAANKSPKARVWVGGDCAHGGEDLTVTAVADGRDAAEDIHKSLMG